MMKEGKGYRPRARDLGIVIGKHQVGKFNAITDVKNVKVGHCTLIKGEGKKTKSGEGPVRTGVTVILPNHDVYNNKLLANGFILNGAGEVSGLTQINEWGLIETPIFLTNTMSVGRVSDSVTKWMSRKHAKIWHKHEVIIPVVGECDDSFLNDAVGQHVKHQHVLHAIARAKSGPVPEGCVGSGTGMICCDLKGGIGTSSRLIKVGYDTFTIGVLVMSNFGTMDNLRVNGYPVGKVLTKIQGEYQKRINNYGSIIVVIATSLPLSAIQLQRLCKRSALGVGRVGSYAAHGSGEIIIGFSTANTIRMGKRKPKYNLFITADDFLNSAYEAVIEATEESIINSLTAAKTMDGVDGHKVPAIDLKLLQSLMHGYQEVEKRLSSYKEYKSHGKF